MITRKAMILGAGHGTRLGELTRWCPKPMLPVGGRPLLEYTLSLLKRHGVEEVVINTHYRPWSVYDHFGYPVGEYDGIEIHYSWERELLGTGGAVRKVVDRFDEPFWVIYGDNLLDVNLQGLEQSFYRNQADMMLGLFHHPYPEMASQVRWAGNCQVTFFEEKPTHLIDAAHLTWSSAGIYLVTPELIRTVSPSYILDFGGDLIPRWVNSRRIHCLPLDGTILDIGTPEGYGKANELTRWWWQRRRFLRRRL
jgi:mannose-1-phosphate guanylyltransferase